jgi:cell division septation protein DedD
MLLVGVGFGAGLLIGVVAKEPELLLGHLRGEGESVSLVQERLTDAADARPSAGETVMGGTEPSEVGAIVGSAGAAGGDEDEWSPAGAGEAASGARTRAMRVAEEGAADAGLPRVAAAPRPVDTPPARFDTPPARVDAAAADRWAIQVGAFSDESVATGLAEGLVEKGYSAALVRAPGDDRRWRVRVQPVAGERRARELADRLKREERLPTWVIPMEAGSGS